MTSKKKEDILKKYFGEELEGTPKNWLMVELGDICEFKRGPFGSSLKKNMFVPKNEKTYKVYEQGNAIRKTIDYGTYYISEEHFADLNGFSVQEGDIIISCAGTIGETFVIPKKYELGVINQALMRVRLTPVILTDYFLLAFDFYIKEIAIKSAQGTAIKNLPPISEMKRMKIGLPSLKEQRRIVDRLSGFYTLLNKAQQLIEEAKETFELRRAAILDKAFRGKLTNSWRNVNPNIEDAGELYEKLKVIKTIKRKKTKEINVSELRYQVPSTWRWVRLGDVLTITSGGTPKRAISEYYNGDIPWIKTGEIKWNYISRSEECISSEALSNSSAKLLPKGTVLVAMYGQGLTRGRAAILNIDATCNQAVCALIPNDFILPEFLYFYFMEGYQRFRQIAKGGNQENLSATVIADFLLPLPPLEEQRAIIDILNSILDKENVIMESIKLEDSIKEIQKSILSKAFRGELGTNDPSEENTIELLKETLQEQVE